MEFCRQEYWSRLPFPSPGNLPDPGIKPASPVSPVLAGGFLPLVPPGIHLQMQETQGVQVDSLGQEDSLEKEMATHSSILAWRIFHGQKSLEGYNP